MIWSPCCPRDSQESSPTLQLESINSSALSLLNGPNFTSIDNSYMTTGKNITFTIWTFVGKVMSLLFNILYRFVIAFLPRSKRLFFFYFIFNFILFLNFTILYWFCHILKWIRHRHTRVPHPEPSSLLPPHTIPLGHPSAPAPSIQYRASNLYWRLVSYMILYIFQCHSPKSSHPLPLLQSPKDCSIHQCLFCYLIYRVIVTIFLNSIYMR